MQHALKIIAILSMACATATAAPDAKSTTPSPSAKPAAATCKPAGNAIFEIDHLAEPEAKLATSLLKVYANGAWTQDRFDTESKPLPQNAGCYAKVDIQKVQSALAGAEWKVTTNQIHCMAVSPAYTIYRINGKSVFIRKLCSGDVLDDKSLAKLQTAISLVEGTVPAQQ